jgi:ribosome biogenesis GTPase A
MGNFWKAVNHVINDSDILLEILDARFPDLTRNEEIEKKVAKMGKTLILVVNKADLVDKKFPKSYVTLSSRTRRGLRSLRERIMIEAKRLKMAQVTVGVLGYPNTGKSSVINALKGKKSALTSPKSGFTQGFQKVKVNNKIYMLDTPGVFPFGEKDEEKHAILGVLNPEKLEYPEDVAETILENFGEVISRYYDCEASLEAIAERFGKRSKGSELNLRSAAIKLIRDWQRGKIVD